MMVIKEDSQSKKPGSEAIVNEDLVEELQWIQHSKEDLQGFYAWFKDCIWAAELVEMGSLSSSYWVILNTYVHRYVHQVYLG